MCSLKAVGLEYLYERTYCIFDFLLFKKRISEAVFLIDQVVLVRVCVGVCVCVCPAMRRTAED